MLRYMYETLVSLIHTTASIQKTGFMIGRDRNIAASKAAYVVFLDRQLTKFGNCIPSTLKNSTTNLVTN